MPLTVGAVVVIVALLLWALPLVQSERGKSALMDLGLSAPGPVPVPKKSSVRQRTQRGPVFTGYHERRELRAWIDAPGALAGQRLLVACRTVDRASGWHAESGGGEPLRHLALTAISDLIEGSGADQREHLAQLELDVEGSGAALEDARRILSDGELRDAIAALHEHGSVGIWSEVVVLMLSPGVSSERLRAIVDDLCACADALEASGRA